jgi:hypothetical protein
VESSSRGGRVGVADSVGVGLGLVVSGPKMQDESRSAHSSDAIVRDTSRSVGGSLGVCRIISVQPAR